MTHLHDCVYLVDMNTHTDLNAEVPFNTAVCHLNPCQIDGYCDQPAAHWVTILGPGMNVPPVDIMGCEFHAAESVGNGEAEFICPVA